MQFWLGTSLPAWLRRLDIPMMVSRVRLTKYKTFPRALGPWVLDSGGFSELSLRGSWTIDAPTYVHEVRRYSDEIGNLEWAAQQDWMCEPFITAKTGLSVAEHQQRTVDNFLELRSLASELPFIPVLQGYTFDDYLRCADLFEREGVALEDEPLVGLGSVCRRQATREIGNIVASFPTLRLHGFGCKRGAIERYGATLASADSMAWSFAGRRIRPCPLRGTASCNNCEHFALEWRESLGRVKPKQVQSALFPWAPPTS